MVKIKAFINNIKLDFKNIEKKKAAMTHEKISFHTITYNALKNFKKARKAFIVVKDMREKLSD